MSSRDLILERLHSYSPQAHSKKKISVPNITKGSVERFTKRATEAGAKVLIVDKPEEVKAEVEKIIADFSGDIILSSDDYMKDLGIKDMLLANDRIATEVEFENVTNYKKKVFMSAIGITSCEYGIAETGSIVIEHNDQNERLLSLAPETYICILRAEQILENRYMLAKIIEENTRLPSAYSIITGVSRTADVALQVVLGMHGPKNVFIIICTASEA